MDLILEKGVRLTPSQKNQNQLDSLNQKVSKAKSIVIADYSGTTVKDQVTLRASIRKAGGEVIVAKNTLIDIAVGKGKLAESLHGMSAAILSYEDPIAPVKALFEFHKKSEKLAIKQGFMDDKVLSANEVEALSKLPSKNELIAKLLMILNSPGTNLVNVLNAGPRNLVYALNAVAGKK
jgi:large subunit ribosomal protein L10